ncbi:MAG: hypothetical protein WKF86_00675 [Acidimicrobiales bacterium]
MAVVLGVSSAAWACTVWRGKLSVWGVAPTDSLGRVTGSSGTVSGVGSGTGMTYCNNGAATGQANVGPVGAPTREIRLSVEIVACGANSGKLGTDMPSVFNVNYLPDKSADCMNGTHMGQFDLKGGATPAGGEGPFTIPGIGSNPNNGVGSTGLGGWADICIDDSKTIYGNQVPIFLL